MQDHAFETPVLLRASPAMVVRTTEEAASILRRKLKERFSLAGLNTLLLLERANDAGEINEARQAFWSWASQELLLSSPLRRAS